MLTILAMLVTLGIVVLAEYLSRYKGVHSELTRKLVHMAVGIFVATWPFFLSWRQIQFMSLAFFIVISLSAKFNIFQAIHAVKRNIMGELLFAIVIGVLAVISTQPWVFAAAMLHLSLADGLAAIVGLGWGESNTYKVFGTAKSRAGTLAFAITSVLVTALFILNTSGHGLALLLLVPLVATAAENLAVQGMDNLVMPIIVALLLSSSL